MKFNIPDKCKRTPLVLFHTIREHDLDAIIQSSDPDDLQCYLTAPSIGITKKPKILTKFGDIVLVGEKELLEKNAVEMFERDIWSPTMRKVPDKLYLYSPQTLAKRVFRRFPSIGRLFKKWGEENVYYGSQNAIIDFASSEYEVWSKLENYLKKQPELSEKYGEDVFAFIKDIAKDAFPEVTKTRKNIVKWFKQEYKEGEDITGKDPFAYAYAIAAPKVPIEELETIASMKLVCDESVDFDKIKEEQWEVINRLRDLPRFSRDFFNVQKIAGESLKGGTYGNFLEEMNFYRVSEQELNETFADIGGSRGFYDKLREKVISIPSEYFEGKTLDAVPINDFKRIFVPAGKGEIIAKIRKKCGFVGDIREYTLPSEIE